MNSLKDKQDLLLAAIKANNFNETKRLLDSNGLVVDQNFSDYNLLIQALCYGYQKIAKLLIEKGCRVFCNKKDEVYCTPLYYAVRYNSKELIKILLDKGARIKDKDANRETALVLAMKNECFDIVDIMLLNYSADNIDINDEDDVRHFHIAVMRNNTKVVATFLYHGMKIDQTSQIKSINSRGYTPLHFAVEYKAIEVVKLLLSNKANFGLKNRTGLTPLHLAFYLENSKEKNEIINLILTAHLKTMVNPIDKNGISHFHIACSTSNLKLLKAFLKFKVDCNSCVFPNSNILPGYSPLHIAVKYSCKDTVKFLLNNKADVNKTVGTGTGVTPLHLSVESDIEIVKLLLKYNADVCATDNDNNTAFHKAIEKTQINELSETRKAIIHLLFSVHQGKMKNVSNKEGVSLFHIACAVGKDQRIIENFLKQNININACVKKNVLWSNYSALHFAILNGNLKVIQILLKNNDSLKMINSDKHSPLYWVCKHWFNDVSNSFSVKFFPTKTLKNEDFEDLNKRLELIHINRLVMLKLFLKKEEMHDFIMFDVFDMFVDLLPKEKVNSEAQLEGLMINQWIEVFKKITITLIHHGCDVNKKGNKNESFLNCVIQLLENFYHISIVEMIESLLICGAQVDIEEGENNLTPLMLASIRGLEEVVRILLKYKADPNKCSKSHDTPLSYGFISGNLTSLFSANNISAVKVVDLLIANGAKVNVKDSGGFTPLHYAARYPCFHKILLNILESNCTINSQNIDGNTALHIACICYNLPAMTVLLEYGADINLENKMKATPVDLLFLPNLLTESHLMECTEMLKIIELHVIKLSHIGFNFSKSINLTRKQIKVFFKRINNPLDFENEELNKELEEEGDYSCEDNLFIDLCDRELERMRNFKIDSYTLLYNILFKNDHDVSKNVNNKYLQDLLKSSKLKENFPLYGYILNLQYKKGLEKYKVLKPAIGVLQTLFRGFPDVCYERILASFTNDELKKLIM